MKLFEYQAKQLFKEAGIPVSDKGVVIYYPEEIAYHKLTYPIVLKTQVLTGGRGKLGGIKFAANTEEAIEVAQKIFDLPIKGEKPHCLLIDYKAAIKREMYVSITLDRQKKCPIIIGASEGGVEIETNENVQIVEVTNGEYSSNLARKMAYLMGLAGKEFQQVSSIIDKLYKLYEKYDLDLAEINPLVQLEDGSIMALDGKITLNGDSFDRQPRFKDWKNLNQTDLSDREKKAAACDLNLVELGDGDIGILCNGAGLTMATMDLVKFSGGNPANFLDVGGGANKNKVMAALSLVISNPNVKVVFVNILGGITACDQVAAPLMDFKKKYPQYKLVVRLLGNNQDIAREMLKDSGIEFIDDLDSAVNAAVTASK